MLPFCKRVLMLGRQVQSEDPKQWSAKGREGSGSQLKRGRNVFLKESDRMGIKEGKCGGARS